MLELDFLLIDTHPGLNEETLLSIAVSDKLIVIMRPDQQDFEGSSVTLRVASRLHVEQIGLILNKVPVSFDPVQLKQEVEKNYGYPVEAIIPHSDDVMILGSKTIFCEQFPDHEITNIIKSIGHHLIE